MPWRTVRFCPFRCRGLLWRGFYSQKISISTQSTDWEQNLDWNWTIKNTRWHRQFSNISLSLFYPFKFPTKKCHSILSPHYPWRWIIHGSVIFKRYTSKIYSTNFFQKTSKKKLYHHPSIFNEEYPRIFYRGKWIKKLHVFTNRSKRNHS